MSNRSHGIVVDADIARSAGVTEHPVSKSSREALIALRDSPSFHLVFCPKLGEEWKVHKSRFSTTWLASMYARRKVKTRMPPSVVESYIGLHAGSEKNIEIALKDKHLVDSALHGDNVIVSNDGTARDVFSLVSKDFQPLKGVFWVSPNKSSRCLVNFLMSNDNPDESWKL